MALFGCSPLLLTFLADNFFTFVGSNGDSVLNVTRYLTCLSVVAGLAHLFGALTLPPRPSTVTPIPSATEEAQRDEPSVSDEVSPLLRRRSLSSSSSSSLAKPPSVQVEVTEVLEVPPPQHGSTLDLLRDPCFWTLLFIGAIYIGCVSVNLPLLALRHC